MTEEIRNLLAQIRPPHAPKKRTTVIRLAFAKANQQPLAQVFGQADTCAENVWYVKWQRQPEIKAAFDVCCRRALEWADEETALQEDHFRRERRRSVAQYAAQAPLALAAVMGSENQRGADRISAADTLMRWAEPEDAAKIAPTARGMVEQTFVAFQDAIEKVYGDPPPAEDGAEGG